VLPAFLLHRNKWRGTNHFIIIGFFLISASLVLILDANVVMLGGVFTYSFLGVLALFSFGAMLFKLKRSQIPREYTAAW